SVPPADSFLLGSLNDMVVILPIAPYCLRRCRFARCSCARLGLQIYGWPPFAAFDRVHCFVELLLPNGRPASSPSPVLISSSRKPAENSKDHTSGNAVFGALVRRACPMALRVSSHCSERYGQDRHGTSRRRRRAFLVFLFIGPIRSRAWSAL